MKKVKLAVVRTIITEEYYEVIVKDSVVKELESLEKDKNAIVELIEDELQKAKRKLQKCKYIEQSVSDKVTFVKMKFSEMKE